MPRDVLPFRKSFCLPQLEVLHSTQPSIFMIQITHYIVTEQLLNYSAHTFFVSCAQLFCLSGRKHSTKSTLIESNKYSCRVFVIKFLFLLSGFVLGIFHLLGVMLHLFLILRQAKWPGGFYCTWFSFFHSELCSTCAQTGLCCINSVIHVIQTVVYLTMCTVSFSHIRKWMF